MKYIEYIKKHISVTNLVTLNIKKVTIIFLSYCDEDKEFCKACDLIKATN